MLKANSCGAENSRRVLVCFSMMDDGSEPVFSIVTVCADTSTGRKSDLFSLVMFALGLVYVSNRSYTKLWRS